VSIHVRFPLYYPQNTAKDLLRTNKAKTKPLLLSGRKTTTCYIYLVEKQEMDWLSFFRRFLLITFEVVFAVFI
jgi:hypothetical protein